MSVLLSVRGLVKRFGGLTATDHFSLDLPPGELHAMIGPNGAGKTTVMSQLTGELRSDAGEIVFDGQSIGRWPVPLRALRGIARSYQITQLLPGFSVLENVMLMAQARLGHSFGIWKPARRQDALTRPALEALAQVGLAQRAHDEVMELGHGEHRQLELAMALAMQPRLLLLDEPLAGMSQAESATMVALLREIKRRYTILLVEHDMQAVFSLADRISVLVYGRAIASAEPAAIQADPAVQRAYLGEA
ncbi:MAG: ABC transporter ATP-binding protein [Burkholderiaceae bacterium]|jgi:branched-chain amino acid transport system ATP-binding protein|nr:ABC transporter ATP-binding protein [Burkholderiaceae bacterium]